MNKRFDINKHKHFNEVIEYLDAIVNQKYYWTIEKLSSILDMTEQYIQINYIGMLDTLYIDAMSKGEIKDLLFKFKKDSNRELLKEHSPELYEYLLELSYYKNILSKRVLIKEESAHNLIMNIFKRVNNNQTEKITEDDLQLILEHKLMSHKKAKEHLCCKYDTQLYRNLLKYDYIKYTIEDDSKKNNKVRYLFL